MSPFDSRCFVLTLALALAPLGCALETGYVRLAQPHVYDSATTREQLAASGERVSEKIRKEAKLETTQEASSHAETTALSLRAGGQGAAPGSAPGTPTLPAAAAVENAKVGGVVADAAKAFGRTIDEQVNDIVHAESQALEAHLLYSGKGNAALGPDSRVYLVRFDIGLLPSRQSRYSYPWWALQTMFGSVYRFTEGWFARVTFDFQGPQCGENGPVYVYDVDPRYGVTTALDSLANVSQLQLAASYAAPGGAAALEYLNRLEEQFAQQRRYPLEVGFLEGPCRFSWVFGPRRVVQKRGLVRFVPFVNDYEVRSRLEPGTRSGHVVLVVSSQEKLEATDALAQSPSATPPAVRAFKALDDDVERPPVRPPRGQGGETPLDSSSGPLREGAVPAVSEGRSRVPGVGSPEQRGTGLDEQPGRTRRIEECAPGARPPARAARQGAGRAALPHPRSGRRRPRRGRGRRREPLALAPAAAEGRAPRRSAQGAARDREGSGGFGAELEARGPPAAKARVGQPGADRRDARVGGQALEDDADGGLHRTALGTGAGRLDLPGRLERRIDLSSSTSTASRPTRSSASRWDSSRWRPARRLRGGR